MLAQKQRLSSLTDLETHCYTPMQNINQQRKSALIYSQKENIPSYNIFKSPKNGLVPYQYSQKIQLQTKSKAMNNFTKSPNMNSNYRIVSLPFNESKENEIMNRPIPSYMDRYLAQAQSKLNNREEGTQSSRNISSPHYQQQQQQLASQSPKIQQQFINSPIPQSLSSKILKDRSSFLLKTPQNGIKLPQANNFDQSKGKTANGFFTQKLKIKNSSNYFNNYLTPTYEETYKVPSCPILFDDIENDRSPKPETLTPNKRTTCRRTKFIFKKYMDDNQEIAQISPDQLTANAPIKAGKLNIQGNSAEKENIKTNNSLDKSEDFSQLKKYYGQKYEPKLCGQQDQRTAGFVNVKSKRLQMILKQRDNNAIQNNFTTNDLIYEYDMKPWENKNETLQHDQMDTSLQEILNQLC